MVKPTYRLHIGAWVNAALFTNLLTEIAKVLPHCSYEVKFSRFSDEKPIVIDDEDSGVAALIAQPPVAEPATASDPGHNTNNNPTAGAGTSNRLLPTRD